MLGWITWRRRKYWCNARRRRHHQSSNRPRGHVVGHPDHLRVGVDDDVRRSLASWVGVHNAARCRVNLNHNVLVGHSCPHKRLVVDGQVWDSARSWGYDDGLCYIPKAVQLDDGARAVVARHENVVKPVNDHSLGVDARGKRAQRASRRHVELRNVARWVIVVGHPRATLAIEDYPVGITSRGNGGKRVARRQVVLGNRAFA